MISLFDSLREITFASIAVRMFLAVICGGFIGMERARKRRPAGFRTHILICLGSAITTMTSEFLYLNMNYYTDIARIGAQVVAGIGFIGAGTIIVTRQRRVRGLTTAAGLWVAAIIGLALGFGFYEGGIAVTIVVLIAEIYLSRLESHILDRAPECNLYIEYTGKENLTSVIAIFRSMKCKLRNMEVTKMASGKGHKSCAIFSLRLNNKEDAARLIEGIRAIDGVDAAEEI